MLIFYAICISYIFRQGFTKKPLYLSGIPHYYKRVNYSKFQDVFIYKKCLVVKPLCNCHSISNLLHYWIANAWYCEKFKVNLEFTHDSDAKGVETFFENYIDLAQYRKNHPQSDITIINGSTLVTRRRTCIRIGEHLVPPEVGNKTLSKLSIRADLEKHTDEYLALNTNEDWVAVHFRGTDVIVLRKKLPFRYTITLESYIVYLKEVLDNRCRIFACSDQAQFIDEMQVAFPGRVFTRDTQRSTDHKELHRHVGKNKHQQKKMPLWICWF